MPGVPTIIQTSLSRDEVLAGELLVLIFDADLWDVVYRKPCQLLFCTTQIATRDTGHLPEYKSIPADRTIYDTSIIQPLQDGRCNLDRIEEQITELVEPNLIGNKEGRLEELIAAADQVKSETKLTEILAQLDRPLAGRSVLFFTEYKATQSLLMSELQRRFGDGWVAFINREGSAEGARMQNGQIRSLTEEHQSAAERFHAGTARFLVSTKAAGEGIDLQKQCHTLFHVDFPWNPMRLHQRVDRLYRYGQTEQVEVFTLRNPNTVESRIWDKLNAKIEQIMLALGEVMEQLEDLLELVLGMTSPKVSLEIFSDIAYVPLESLASRFDQKTTTFGGRDMLDAVRDLVGQSARFDFQEMSDRIRTVDLPALRPFFVAMLAINNRRAQESGAGLAFKTPDNWLSEPASRTNYTAMVFSHDAKASRNCGRVLGLGHVIFHEAVRQARESTATVWAVPGTLLPGPILIFRVAEQVTSSAASVRSVIAAVDFASLDNPTLFSDWQLIDLLNGLLKRRTFCRDGPPTQVLD